jgi:hypothetical protein
MRLFRPIDTVFLQNIIKAVCKKLKPGATYRLLFLIPLLALFFSCSARIDGVVREGGGAELSLKMSLEPRTTALIRSLQGFMGEATGAAILDGAAIGRSMAAAPGIRSISLINTGPAALEGTISISNVGDFLSAGAGQAKFITYTEGRSAGASSITIVLNRISAPALISRLSPEAGEYLEALMAPVVLGESSTRQEYLGLVSLVYGRALADEIAAARIRASIEFPRPLAAVRGGIASGRFAEFDIPLVDLLVLEQPLTYEISW